MDVNIKLLNGIRAYILAHPEELDMENWDGCIGAWAISIALNKTPKEIAQLRSENAQNGIPYQGLVFPPFDLAAGLLGLPRSTAKTLFFISNWPTKFSTAYLQAIDDTNRSLAAHIAADRIDELIADVQKPFVP